MGLAERTVDSRKQVAPPLKLFSAAKERENEPSHRGTRLRISETNEMSSLPIIDPVPPTEPPELSSTPSDFLLDELQRESERLESATPQEILKWAVERYAPKFTMATALAQKG